MPSPKQIKIIHALANKVFPDRDEYRSALSSFNATSSKDLSTEQATKLIKSMMQMVNPDTVKVNKVYKARGKRGVQAHLTQLQADRIAILIKLLKWNEPKRLTGFIERQTSKLKAVDMLANYEATRVIVGLEKILSSGNQETFLSINKMSNEELERCL